MFENKLILCPPKPSTWLTITTHPVLERCRYPTWLPSAILVVFNLFSQFNRNTKGINIPILPMASLTFAEAKAVAPPILPRKHPANTAQITKGPY